MPKGFAAGRRPGYTWDEASRLKIKSTEIVNRLRNCYLGKIELSSQQVRAAEILLKKVLPDLSAREITGTMHHIRRLAEMTDDELASIVAAERAGERVGTIAPPDSPPEPDSIH